MSSDTSTLKSLVNDCLESGSHGAISIRSPYNKELHCASIVKSVCDRKALPLITLRADSCGEREVLGKLYEELSSAPLREDDLSTFEQTVALLKRHPGGILCFVLTRPMRRAVRSLILRLRFQVKQSKLHWRFVVIDSDSEDLNRVSVQLNVEHNIRWRCQSQTWSLPTMMLDMQRSTLGSQNKNGFVFASSVLFAVLISRLLMALPV